MKVYDESLCGGLTTRCPLLRMGAADLIDFPYGGQRRPPASFWHARLPLLAKHFWSSFRSDLSSFHRLLGSLAVSWSLLGGSWRPLGASLGALGGVLGPLGPSWRRSKTTPKQHVKKEGFQEQKKCDGVDLGGGLGEPKSTQIDTQNESKFKTIFKSEKVALQEPLGALLSRSWSFLEGILGSKFALRY